MRDTVFPIHGPARTSGRSAFRVAVVDCLTWALLALCAGLALFAGRADAHVAGFTDTSIQIAATGVRIVYTAPVDNLIELDRVPGAAAPAASPSPAHYLSRVRDGWRVEAGGERCLLSQADAREVAAVGAFQYRLTYVCPGGLDRVAIAYGLFVDRWTEHENFVRVFMAGQRQRMRFTAEQPRLDVPVADLLRQWQRPLAAGFFDADPNHANALAQDADERALPRIAEQAPSLGTLHLDQLDPGFIQLGMRHILAGADHVLFVAGLVLLARRGRDLLLLVTAFTAAHAVTMALATLGVIRIDPRWTEPLIALTIVYIGAENLFALRAGAGAADGTARFASIRRIALVFAFGLVHGLGFSDVLREMGLREDLLGALLYFNLGVEAGQLGIIAVVLPLILLCRRLRWARHIGIALSAAVAVTGAAMLVSRL